MNGMILLVEDNEQILNGNARMLRRRGYEVMTALSLREAWERIDAAEPDVIVLDIMLPDGSGLDFMRKLRKKSNILVMFLTGLTTPGDIVRGLNEGGDDYLTKPYDFDVFLARIEALLRRSGRVPGILRKGSLKLDVISGRALLEEGDLRLTQKDFALLLLFAQNENKLLRAEYLYENIWKMPMSGDSQALKSAVSRLRKKLGSSGYVIVSTRGEGYTFTRK